MGSKRVIEYVYGCEEAVEEEFHKYENVAFFNSMKVLNAFHNNKVSESHLTGTTGYGYNDYGRDIVEKVYADVFKCEDALVRNQLISGTHALTVALNAMLRPNDMMLSITGKPYDTLDKVIGIEYNPSSLTSYGVKYEQVDLKDNDFDKDKIYSYLLREKVKLITIQRSKGYSTRESISIEKIAKIIKDIRRIDKKVIIMVDNCYCEFVDYKEPTQVGADLVVGSLIKNLGAGIATNGAYICGRHDLVELCAERLNVPGQGKEVGPSGNANRMFLLGLYMAPQVVLNSLKTAILLSYVMESIGFEVSPKFNDKRVDIVQNIIFKTPEKLINFCKMVQASSAIDSHVEPVPSDMPGYTDKVIMASGSFTQGSSIEISCDGPLRPPYIAYFQGSLSYDYGKIAIINILNKFIGDEDE
ncbi:MAG: methionine gamma-lyase family protein [Bacilli bacterium]|nr:methionine gamma-lyase family protein [Bacilli bacterium]